MAPGDEVAGVHFRLARSGNAPSGAIGDRRRRRANHLRDGLPVGQLAVPIVRPLGRCTTRPSSASTWIGSTSQRAAAISSSTCRAAAAARRELRRHVGRRSTAERAHLERRLLRIGHHHRHAAERDAELVGHGLRQRRADVLTELRLPGEHRPPPRPHVRGSTPRSRRAPHRIRAAPATRLLSDRVRSRRRRTVLRRRA